MERRKPTKQLEYTIQIRQDQELELVSYVLEICMSMDSSNHESTSPIVDNSNLPMALSKGIHSCIEHQIENYLIYEKLLPSNMAFMLLLMIHRFQTWLKSIKNFNIEIRYRRRISALESYDTWTFLRLPCWKKPVGCKCIFIIKYKADESIERYKAQLVAKGFMQSYKIDYLETFAKLNTIRVLVSL